MTHPQRRIMLYPIDAKHAEIVILGDPLEIAPLFVAITQRVGAWQGFEFSGPLVGVAGLIVCIGALANTSDPMGEVLECLRRESFDIRWAGCTTSARVGMVGTW